jgi:hypothetical protein
MPATAIVDNFGYGMRIAEIAEQFEISQYRFLFAHEVITVVELKWPPQLVRRSRPWRGDSGKSEWYWPGKLSIH